MSRAAKRLARAVEVYHLADAIGCDAETVEFCRGVALEYATAIIAEGMA